MSSRTLGRNASSKYRRFGTYQDRTTQTVFGCVSLRSTSQEFLKLVYLNTKSRSCATSTCKFQTKSSSGCGELNETRKAVHLSHVGHAHFKKLFEYVALALDICTRGKCEPFVCHFVDFSR